MLKRKRISVACNSCRAKKVKCDGHQPICGRCAGYSYTCSWSAAFRSRGRGRAQASGRSPHVLPTAPSGSSEGQGNTPPDMLAACRDWICSVCISWPPDKREEILASFDALWSKIDDGVESPTVHNGESPQRPQGWGYLGETSDVRFVNFVRNVVSSDANGVNAHVTHAEDPENYDSEQSYPQHPLTTSLTSMPPRPIAQEYLRCYFNTIHIAYPFVGRHDFLAQLEAMLATGFNDRLSQSWLSLMYSLLALGAYYNSFRSQNARPNARTERIDHILFQRSVTLSELNTSERSVIQVSALLAQSFYLLATTKIERCWRQLGITIRMAQSIGLHVSVEDSRLDHTKSKSSDVRDPEMASRVWYSLYVLDRLLALQLGRPPAIADQDCHISIPDRIQELEDQMGDNDGDTSSQYCGSTRCYASQYFISMIEFSSIIGQIIRESCHPRRDLNARVDIVARYDKMLLDWKDRLPRHLRFDLGHAFDKSELFKRQRNMLAVKFHHIRILIYRPYLYYPHFLKKNYHHNDDQQSTIDQDQLSKIKQYGTSCVQEATAIIHLLHNVADAEEVVMNYPWWQMISCLVCAGSVLVVALDNLNSDNTTGDGDNSKRGGTGRGDDRVSGLSENIETCLHILSRLGPYSHGARRAFGMINMIRNRGARFVTQGRPPVPPTPVPMLPDAGFVTAEISGGFGDDFWSFQEIFEKNLDLDFILSSFMPQTQEFGNRV